MRTFLAATQDIQYLETNPQTYLSKSVFPLRRAENAEIPNIPTNTYEHIRETHAKPPQKILFVNISHVKGNFERLLCRGGVIMTALTQELAQLRISVVWKANESWRKELGQHSRRRLHKCHEIPACGLWTLSVVNLCYLSFLSLYWEKFRMERSLHPKLK